MDALCLTIKDTGKALSLGRTKVNELIREQRLQIIKVGRRTLVKTDSIRALVDQAA